MFKGKSNNVRWVERVFDNDEIQVKSDYAIEVVGSVIKVIQDSKMFYWVPAFLQSVKGKLPKENIVVTDNPQGLIDDFKGLEVSLSDIGSFKSNLYFKLNRVNSELRPSKQDRLLKRLPSEEERDKSRVYRARFKLTKDDILFDGEVVFGLNPNFQPYITATFEKGEVKHRIVAALSEGTCYRLKKMSKEFLPNGEFERISHLTFKVKPNGSVYKRKIALDWNDHSRDYSKVASLSLDKYSPVA